MYLHFVFLRRKKDKGIWATEKASRKRNHAEKKETRGIQEALTVTGINRMDRMGFRFRLQTDICLPI